MPEIEDYENELRVAATEGDVDGVLEMIAEGVDIEAGNEIENNAFHLSAYYGQEEVAEVLLRAGVDIYAVNEYGHTALQLACMRGNLNIVMMLTSTDSSLEHLDYKSEPLSGMTALHYASKGGHADTCQHLLDVGATEEIFDYINIIPEYYAANYPTELVFRKYRPWGRDKDGKRLPANAANDAGNKHKGNIQSNSKQEPVPISYNEGVMTAAAAGNQGTHQNRPKSGRRPGSDGDNGRPTSRTREPQSGRRPGSDGDIGRPTSRTREPKSERGPGSDGGNGRPTSRTREPKGQGYDHGKDDDRGERPRSGMRDRENDQHPNTKGNDYGSSNATDISVNGQPPSSGTRDDAKSDTDAGGRTGGTLVDPSQSGPDDKYRPTSRFDGNQDNGTDKKVGDPLINKDHADSDFGARRPNDGYAGKGDAGYPFDEEQQDISGQRAGGPHDEVPYNDGMHGDGRNDSDDGPYTDRYHGDNGDDEGKGYYSDGDPYDDRSDEEYPYSGDNYGGGMPGAVVGAMAKHRDQSPGKGGRNPRDHARGRYGYKPRPGQASMENHGKFKYDRDPKKWTYNRKLGRWERLKDHEFEWSEAYKNRQKMSVYDRLLGGAGKGAATGAAKGNNAGNRRQLQGNDVTKATAVIRAWGGNDGKQNRFNRAKDYKPGNVWGGNDGKQNRNFREVSPDKRNTRDSSPSKGASTEAAKTGGTDVNDRSRDRSRGRYNYKPNPGHASMENHGPFNYDRDPKKWDYKKAQGNWDKVKDHDFQWSEEYRNRQKLSVYDRLLGGSKTRGQETKK